MNGQQDYWLLTRVSHPKQNICRALLPFDLDSFPISMRIGGWMGLGDLVKIPKRLVCPPNMVTHPSTNVCKQQARSTQPCIPPDSINWVPVLIGWSKGRNVTSARWQVTLCYPIWHVSFCSGEACSRTAISGYFVLLYIQWTAFTVANTSNVHGQIIQQHIHVPTADVCDAIGQAARPNDVPSAVCCGC